MRKEYLIAVILIILFSALSVSILAYEENRYSLIQTNYNSLNGTYNSLQSEYNSLTSNYNQLQTTDNNLQNDYYNLQNTYNNLHASYETLYAPSTLIQNGTIHWRFHNVDGTIAEWTDPIDTYRSYVTMQKPTKTLSLHNSYTGTDFSVIDLREYVTSDFFANVVSSFTDGKTDREFVQEVVNFKDQIVTYGSGLGDLYRWPVETLTEGRGQCGDTTILMSSLFKAGENRAHYGLSIYITYCDANHIDNPQTMNHAIVEVKYSDGTYTLIETTANTYYTSVSGWSFQV
jgi:transglutaminase-like putative cysteine protease